MLLAKLLGGALTDQALDFYQILTWTMLTILGGWFGDRMVSRFGGSSLRTRPRTRYSYEPPAYGPEFTGEPEPRDSEEGDSRSTI